MATPQAAPRPNWENPDKIRLSSLWGSLGSIFLISVIMKRPYGSVMTEASRIRLPKREMHSAQHRKKWTADAMEALWASVALNTLPDGLIDLLAVVDHTERPIDVVVGKIADREGINRDQVKGLVWLPRDAERRVAKARKDAGIVDKSNSAEMRPCITCRKHFVSDWVGHRVCPRCKQERGF
jgi:hypothetical protein